MKKQSKHFPWGDNVHAAREQASEFANNLRMNAIDHKSVHEWQDPAFKRTTVEWVGVSA